MTTITISDEATRRVVLSCLWSAFWRRTGGSGNDLGWAAIDAADEAVMDDDQGSAAHVEKALCALLTLTAAVREMRSLPLGSTVDLPLDAAEWQDGPQAVVGIEVGIDEPLFLACDAAGRLLAQQRGSQQPERRL